MRYTARHCDKTLRQDTATRHYGKAIRQALRKDSPEDTADMLVRRKTVVHRRRAPACDGVRPAPTLPCGCYLHLQTTVTKSATRQCGRRCATYGKTLRQDTAVRHYGKAIRQALRKDSPRAKGDLEVLCSRPDTDL